MPSEDTETTEEPTTLTLQYPVITVESDQPARLSPWSVGLIVTLIVALFIFICERKTR